MNDTLNEAVRTSRKGARRARLEDTLQRLDAAVTQWADSRPPHIPQQINLQEERDRTNQFGWIMSYLNVGFTFAWLLTKNKRFRNAMLAGWVIGASLGAYEKSLDRDLAARNGSTP